MTHVTQTPDDKEHGSRAHDKGVVQWDPKTGAGFMMIHSMPLWPNYAENGNTMPLSLKFAQHHVCIALGRQGHAQMSTQLRVVAPFMYGANLHDSDEALFPEWWEMIVRGKFLTREEIGRPFTLKTAAGTELAAFAKNAKWGKAAALDIWADLMVPNLQRDMAVDSWLNGPGSMPPRCNHPSGYNTYNVRTAVFPPAPGTPAVLYPTTKDHSKIGISADPSKPLVCFSGLNRQVSQSRRGGMAICFDRARLYEAFRDVYVSWDSC